jgi:hypothetical protein
MLFILVITCFVEPNSLKNILCLGFAVKPQPSLELDAGRHGADWKRSIFIIRVSLSLELRNRGNQQ